MDRNILYYNKKADEFIASTVNADLSETRDRFLRHIPPGGKILDLGCGSGRDSKAFAEKGFYVLAVDGSTELVKHCKMFLGENVMCETFESFESDDRYDGIWACASLIHVRREDLLLIINKYADMLEENGVFYMSFKFGEKDYEKDERSFTCFTHKSIEKFLEKSDKFSRIDIFESRDARPERNNEKWINILAFKKNINNCVTGDTDHLLSRLSDSIKKARTINILVAFLMESGVRVIADELDEAAKRGAVINILCGNYLNITQPSALYLLKDILGEKVNLRFYTNKSKSFHPKAYIFEYGKYKEIYVGSSNLSLSALTDGIEWNYKINSEKSPDDCKKFMAVFEDLFLNHSVAINDKVLREYSRNWKKPEFIRQMLLMEDKPEYLADKNEPRPTDAQIEALYEIKRSREAGWEKGLVVAATGVGKTYLAAFDSKEYSRILFLAHREEILFQAEQTFKSVRPSLNTGIFNGNKKETKSDVLFASVQSLGKKEYLNSEYFERNYFDYIVVDEFHHAVANQYRNVLDYFCPDFLLGLTATPERLDNQDVFALCDYNVVYEARLHEAIVKGWLVPFRYYGIYDETDYSEISYRNGSYDDFQLEKALSRESRAGSVYDNYRKYNSNRALGFCSGRMHACYMAKYFSDKGISSCAVISGSPDDYSSYDEDKKFVKDRADAIEKLKSGDIKIIFSVDMFNEGVDIPSLDMVMFLRPTESPVVFLQQLGRGLRWHENKKYLNILDFIGNYKNASLIPAFLASAVTSSGKKINITLETLKEELPENCFIDFDLQVIDLFEKMKKEQMQLEDKIREEFERIKSKTGKRPMRTEMYTYMDKDLFSAIKNRKNFNFFRDYLSFLKNIGEISDDEKALLNTPAHAFLKNIEETRMTKLYKMPVLLAFIEGTKLRPFAGKKEISESFKEFYSHKANSVDLLKDKNTKNYSDWTEDDYFNLALKNPIHFLCKSSEEFFLYKNEKLYLGDKISGYLNNKEFVNHYRDIVNYRTRRFYKDRLEEKIDL